MAQARKDANGNVVLYDDNGNPIGGAPYESSEPSVAAPLKELGKAYALSKAKDYAVDKGGALLASQVPGAASGAAEGMTAVGTALDGSTMMAPTSSFLGSTGTGSIGAGPLAAIAAGTYLTGKAAYDQLKGKEDNSAEGKYGRGQLAWSTGGLSEVARLFGIKMGGQSTHQEEKMRADLAKKGINVANAGVKEWELNPTFKASRNEADLTAKDIINSAQLYNQIPNYSALSAAQKEAIANEALKNKLVREHHGTIQINADDAFKKFAASQIPTPTTGSGVRRPTKKQEKKEKEPALLKSLIPEGYVAPNYEKNPTQLFSNPYLK